MIQLLPTILLLIAGLALILFGANYLTDGSAAIARRFNVSGFVIGLTIVALGTSMPEMVVSVVSALKGEGDIAIGNVVGSNIFNTLVILGICALFRPLPLTSLNVYRDIPLGIGASVALAVAAFSGSINRYEGVVLILLYIGMILYTIFNAKPSKEELELEEELEKSEPISMWLALIFIVGGLSALIYGGTLFIDNAVLIAEVLHIPSNVIAITLVAGGTSLPEFAASLVSLIKGKSDIALGNVIGSNIANILLVLGFSSTLTPLTMGGITMVDIGVVVASSALLFLTAFTLGKYKIDRSEGAIMIVIFVLYIAYMISHSLAV
ncbi:MAG: calcium/sodium antiporter [Rikenellaceae bacterium]